MRHLYLITTPEDRKACEAALDAIGLGGELVGKPDPATPADTKPAATYYVTSLQVADADADRIVAVAAGSPDRTLRRALVLAVEDRPGARVEGERLTLREVLTEHAAKDPGIKAEVAKEVAWIR